LQDLIATIADAKHFGDAKYTSWNPVVQMQY
jgi:hypothetical protein